MVKDHSCHPASRLAAAAVLAALTLYKAAARSCLSTATDPAISTISTIWTPTLVHYTAYTASDLLVAAGEMLTQLLAQCSG